MGRKMIVWFPGRRDLGATGQIPQLDRPVGQRLRQTVLREARGASRECALRGKWSGLRRSNPRAESCRHMSLRRAPIRQGAHSRMASLLAGTLRRLRIVCGIRIVLGYSRNEPANGERLQVCLQRVSNVLGIDFPFAHVERKGFQILFLLRWSLDRRLRPLVERIVFHAVLFLGARSASRFWRRRRRQETRPGCQSPAAELGAR
jgi:hypothetical protein